MILYEIGIRIDTGLVTTEEVGLVTNNENPALSDCHRETERPERPDGGRS